MARMKLTDLSLKKAEVKEIEKSDRDMKYPWGLVLVLNEVTLDKMGLEGMPKVGAECELMGVAKVVSVREDQYGKRSVELQLTKLAIEHPGEEDIWETVKQDRKKDKDY